MVLHEFNTLSTQKAAGWFYFLRGGRAWHTNAWTPNKSSVKIAKEVSEQGA
jgi:hypothetical protein